MVLVFERSSRYVGVDVPAAKTSKATEARAENMVLSMYSTCTLLYIPRPPIFKHRHQDHLNRKSLRSWTQVIVEPDLHRNGRRTRSQVPLANSPSECCRHGNHWQPSHSHRGTG